MEVFFWEIYLESRFNNGIQDDEIESIISSLSKIK